ncbi:envelope stress response protein PspG [Vibrio cincinnatiensis]|uniref:envelope stress response protein PspG n=1 Tax=Vibrio cincinnatiensis TaxID=675 RepID=UPI001EDDEE52|nr:envelope stress response protein PspG [Vibrio cincinnatiensis]MCG3748394.1 hypothetical protein [Vibrio cincinnatiensis]
MTEILLFLALLMGFVLSGFTLLGVLLTSWIVIAIMLFLGLVGMLLKLMPWVLLLVFCIWLYRYSKAQPR